MQKLRAQNKKCLKKQMSWYIKNTKCFTHTFSAFLRKMQSIYKFGLSVCLSVCFYPINVKTAEPIGPKFFVGHHVILGKVYGWLNFQKFASIKIRFLEILKIHEFFFENPRIFFVCYLFTRRSPVYFIFTNEIKYRREAP